MLGTFFGSATRNVEPCTGYRAGTVHLLHARTQRPYSRTLVLSYSRTPSTPRTRIVVWLTPLRQNAIRRPGRSSAPTESPWSVHGARRAYSYHYPPINTLKLPRALVQTRREWRMANSLRARTPQPPQPQGTTNNRLLVRSRKSAPATVPPLMRQCNANPPRAIHGSLLSVLAPWLRNWR